MTTDPISAIARQWHLGVKINQLVVNASGTHLAAALGDGRIALLSATDNAQEPVIVTAHENGVSLSLAALGNDFVSGGDDGRVIKISALGEQQELAQQANRWIDHVASDKNGSLIAYSYGKQVQLITAAGAPQGIAHSHTSSIGGLAFSPNGKRLAVSHRDGVSLWWTASTAQQPVVLPWQGSHLQLLWSPDGKIIMTTMQENALHGWRLSDMNEMRMQGYSGKITSMGWSPKGKYLATAGAAQAILWPFFAGGPWGKAPLVVGMDRGVVTRIVTPHPDDEMVAIGYQDGLIELSPMDSRTGFLVHPPVAERGHEVTGLVWNTNGDCLFASTNSGYIMLFTVDSVAAAARV